MIRNLSKSDLNEVRTLAGIAAGEGFRFLQRLVAELECGSISLDSSREFFLVAVAGSEIVGIGGVTPDPYVDDSTIGRVRHLYVRPDYRRKSVGRRLLHEIEVRANPFYAVLRLRTDTVTAAGFYEALGYDRITDATATHVRGCAAV